MLSGGNQQKIVIGKWLVAGARLFLLDEPTCGIDVGAKEEIFAVIGDLVANGAAVLMIDSEQSEIVHVWPKQPITGFYRDGCCNTGPEDIGSHTVCAVMTADFLEFSKSRGNDLSTPLPEFGFPGLRPGDRWCLCAPRWQEALDANRAPRVVLRATHEGAWFTVCSLI